MQHYVYVLDMDGNPLMPTKRYGWVRRALKSGKAKAVYTVPFTIQLLYQPQTHELQDVRISVDPGRTNIGIAAVRGDGKCLFRTKAETCNKDIRKHMEKRKIHRQASRRGERLARKRLAKRLGTTVKGLMKRKLPGYKDGVLTYKDIINTESRFNNRKHKPGWLTPTVTQLLRTHENLIVIVKKFLPLTSASVEVNKFDIERIKNPEIHRWEYGKGPLKGYSSIRAALVAMQNGRCLLCGKLAIEHDHHIVPRSLGGSDDISNIAGICQECHEKLHHDDALVAKLSTLKNGTNKKYHALACINQIILMFIEWLETQFPGNVNVIAGWGTKEFRDNNNYSKDHDIDAYCIAAATMTNATPDKALPPCYFIKQYRRHDRAIIHSQEYRTYQLDGVVVAKNRRTATEVSIAKNGKMVYKKQKVDSLEVWFGNMVKQYGQKEAERMRSRLIAIKSTRNYNDLTRIMNGSIFYYKGKRYVLSGRLTRGAYYRAEGHGKKNFPAKDCTLFPGGGLVFVS